jgi:ribosomal protein L3
MKEIAIEYAKGILGKEVTITDFAPEGAFIDVIAITTGKRLPGSHQAVGHQAAVPQEQQAPAWSRQPRTEDGPDT